MIYQIAVCDDSDKDRAFISGLVQCWAKARQAQITLQTFASADAFLFAYADNRSFDLLLLDIEMPGMDGVSLARRLRQSNETLQIIFVTGYSDYIAEGYDVEALHYLMKPVREDKLLAVLDRAVEKLHRNERILDLRTTEGLIRVPIRRIRYIDVRLNYITIHAQEDITVKMSLGEAAEMLDERFYRVGRSAIVNLMCISRVTKSDIVLLDGATSPLPRGAYEGVNRAIINMR